MSTLVTLSGSASIDEVAEVIERDGGVIVEDMLSTDLLERFWAEIGPHLEKTVFGAEGFTGSATRRCSSLLGKSLSAGEMVTQKHFLGAALKLIPQPYDFILGETAEIIMPTLQVSATQAVQIWPGQKAQPLHRDDCVHHRRHPGPQSQLQVLYAASDYTAENGATLVVPGSHLWDDVRKPTINEAVPAVMRRGAGVIFLGSTYHAGGANVSENSSRTGVSFSLALGYLRQEENQYLAVPRDMVLRHSQEVQNLLGYKACPPFGGWVEMQEPSVVLHDPEYSTKQATNLY
ncbi:MAG: phytanoyl-CoA dioxygenase family protein [Janthinobacterium lividum]